MLLEVWKEAKLADVCQFINGRAYKKNELQDRGKYRVLRVGNFFTNENWYYSDLELDEEKYCEDGDLLYAWSASFAPKIWIGDKVIYHYHIWKIVIDPLLVDKEYLYYFLEWDVDNIKSTEGSGSTMIHVTKGSMEQRLFHLPPLEEQRRIAEVLRAVDDVIVTNAKALSQAVCLLRQSRFALTGLDGSRPDWQGGPLLDFFQLQRGHDLPVQDRNDGPIPVIASNGPVGMHNKAAIPAPAVVTGRSGTIGKVTYFDGPCWPLNTTLFVRDYKGSNPRYVFHFLSAFPLADYQSGTGVPTLNRNDVHVVEVAWPALEEQSSIATALDALEQSVATMSAGLDQLRTLKTQLSGDLLSGRVRVPV